MRNPMSSLPMIARGQRVFVDSGSCIKEYLSERSAKRMATIQGGMVIYSSLEGITGKGILERKVYIPFPKKKLLSLINKYLSE